MPSFSKKAMSLYLRNGCERQFIMSLYGNLEREPHGLPPRQQARAGLGLVGAAGYEWQDEKVGELKEVFGLPNVHENAERRGKRPGQIPLLNVMPVLAPYHFVVEAEYQADTPVFRAAVGLTDVVDYYGQTVDLSRMHPDIIQVLPSMAVGEGPNGEESYNPYELAVLPNGDTSQLVADDDRLRLRVIDVKLSSEPGAHYFAEVVYYSMTLAAWLVDQELNDRFVVIAAPAVWPGSHEGSELSRFLADCQRKARQPRCSEMALALAKDIEVAPFGVFAPRLRRLLAIEFPALLKTPWEKLAWHVDFRCKGCEFLGFHWLDRDGNPTEDPRHCLPTAEAQRHLCRVVGLSRGAAAQLRRHSVNDVAGLAQADPVHSLFNEHQTLRAKRTVFPSRAKSLADNATSIIPKSGGDALMPRWPDLHIYIFLDYDLSSAITAVIALRAFWKEPLPFKSPEAAQKRFWPPRKNDSEDGEDRNLEELLFPVDQRQVDRERGEVLRFLRALHRILEEVQEQDRTDTAGGRRQLDKSKTENSTYQIYLWDESQRKHLVRLVGRHLPYILADEELRDLAWLFPPPELLPRAEDSTRKSPITLVADVVANTVAVPVPHHYRLMDVAQSYHLPTATPPRFHRLYQEPMSDLIPGERLHEWWQHVGDWNQVRQTCLRTTRNKTIAMSMVVARLEKDLKDLLSRQAAPGIPRPERRELRKASIQGRLWYEYTRLNVALDELEIHAIRTMPPHEREARLKSARLTQRLSGSEQDAALVTLNRNRKQTLVAGDGLFVYAMRPASRDVNLKPSEFTWALAPEGRHSFLEESAWYLLKETGLAGEVRGQYTVERAGLTSVKVEAIDRVNGFIALRAGPQNRIAALERETDLRFDRNVILDPTHSDFLTDKIALTVEGIGNPTCAEKDQRALEALGIAPVATRRGAKEPPETPAAGVLWRPTEMAGQLTGRELSALRSELGSHFSQGAAPLDDSQWLAWEHALAHRFSLLWGPPGTGKSRTLRAIILGAVTEANSLGKAARVLISANTYTAVDNVLLELAADLALLLPSKSYRACRVQSKWSPEPDDFASKHPGIENIILNTARPSAQVAGLLRELQDASNILLVGTVPQQLHNLAVAGKTKKERRPSDTIRSWFDLIVLDEASQIDVAGSTLVLSKLAPGGACVLAGDDLQLPPIQAAEPPKDLEHVVGSAYDYFRRHHRIEPQALNVNYRANETLVEFTRMAGYSQNLRSYYPELKLHLIENIPVTRPTNWPESLYWSPHWAKFLDPDHAAVAFVYDDSMSSQVNAFEADTVAALLWLLRTCMGNTLDNERRGDDPLVPSASEKCNVSRFWDRAVGVVTPHRAQMAKTVGRLQEIFDGDPSEAIRSAVDTVERFQGQQRDVIIASFGVGDPDIITAEDEFLYNLNRFNVLTSRARAKLIVLVSRSVLEHLSDDAEVLNDSRLLKLFAETYCVEPETIELGYYADSQLVPRGGQLQRR